MSIQPVSSSPRPLPDGPQRAPFVPYRYKGKLITKDDVKFHLEKFGLKLFHDEKSFSDLTESIVSLNRKINDSFHNEISSPEQEKLSKAYDEFCASMEADVWVCDHVIYAILCFFSIIYKCCTGSQHSFDLPRQWMAYKAADQRERFFVAMKTLLDIGREKTPEASNTPEITRANAAELKDGPADEAEKVQQPAEDPQSRWRVPNSIYNNIQVLVAKLLWIEGSTSDEELERIREDNYLESIELSFFKNLREATKKQEELDRVHEAEEKLKRKQEAEEKKKRDAEEQKREAKRLEKIRRTKHLS